MEYIVFHIEGGIGKNIMATAVAKAIKNKYPNKTLVVVTAWEEPWVNNPNVYRVYKFGNLTYFYDDIIKDKDTLIFMHDPYHTSEHIYSKEHLIKTWCSLVNVEYNGETPELFFTPREIDYVKNQRLSKITKPIFMIQSNGGMQDMPYSWSRDIPFKTSQDVVNAFANDYHIFHVKRENQPLLNNAEPLTLPLREIFICLLFSQKRLFIDSFCQHAAAALGLPSVVTWVVNKPEVFGYNLHKNIVSNVEEKYRTTKYSYLSPYNIIGTISEYPYDTRELFNVDDIINAL